VAAAMLATMLSVSQSFIPFQNDFKMMIVLVIILLMRVFQIRHGFCAYRYLYCFLYSLLTYFPGVARVFIYPNLIAIYVPRLAEIAHLDGILSIITSTLLDGTLPLFPRRCPGIYLSQSYSQMCTKLD
jgi:hypothetical protein